MYTFDAILKVIKWRITQCLYVISNGVYFIKVYKIVKSCCSLTVSLTNECFIVTPLAFDDGDGERGEPCMSKIPWSPNPHWATMAVYGLSPLLRDQCLLKNTLLAEMQICYSYILTNWYSMSDFIANSLPCSKLTAPSSNLPLFLIKNHSWMSITL